MLYSLIVMIGDGKGSFWCGTEGKYMSSEPTSRAFNFWQCHWQPILKTLNGVHNSRKGLIRIVVLVLNRIVVLERRAFVQLDCAVDRKHRAIVKMVGAHDSRPVSPWHLRFKRRATASACGPGIQ